MNFRTLLRQIAFAIAVTPVVLSFGCGRRSDLPVARTHEAKPRIVSTTAEIVHGLDLGHRSLIRLSNGTIYIARGQPLAVAKPVLKISADGQVTTMAFASDYVARDPYDNAYFSIASGILKLTIEGKLSVFAGKQDATDQATVDDDIDGLASRARFSSISGLASDSAGNIYVQETTSPRFHIRRVSKDGLVSTYLVDSVSDPLPPDNWSGGAFGVDAKGNVYLAGSGIIRKVSPMGDIKTIAPPESARFSQTINGIQSSIPWGDVSDIKVDHRDTLFAMTGGCGIRKIAGEGAIETISGTNMSNKDLIDGPASKVGVCPNPGIDIGSDGAIYFVDSFTNALRKLGNDGILTTIVRGDLPLLYK